MRFFTFFLLAFLSVATPTVHANPFVKTETNADKSTRLDLAITASEDVTPDLALITASVVTEAKTATEARSKNAEKMLEVMTALKATEIAKNDIQTSGISLNPQYRYENNQAPMITGYQANNTVSIKIRDISKTAEVIDIVISKGVNQLNGPSFDVAKPEIILDRLRAKAMANARARADIYAKAAGLKISHIIGISEGGAGYMPPMPFPQARAEMMSASAAAPTQISAGLITLSLPLTVSFALE
jgi:hypothetical protein